MDRCTLQWGSNIKQVPVIAFFDDNYLAFDAEFAKHLKKEHITSLSIFQIFVSIDFTFQFNLVVYACLWPHDHHEKVEKVEKVHGKAREKNARKMEFGLKYEGLYRSYLLLTSLIATFSTPSATTTEVT